MSRTRPGTYNRLVLLSIRLATLADAEAIARVDLETHVEAYRPLLGEDYGTNATLDETTDYWRKLLSKDISVTRVETEVLVAEREGEIIAYSGIGPSRDADAGGAGEVFTLYVHPSGWRGGIGALLLGAALDRLRELGFAEVTLWVMEVNSRARAFYEAQGWQPDGATEATRGRPGFRNLRYRAPRDHPA